jgi:hypothetical protein
MKSKSSWRWYINTVTDSLDIIHRPVFYLKQRNGDWTLPPSSGETPTQLGRTEGLALSIGHNWSGFLPEDGGRVVFETLS